MAAMFLTTSSIFSLSMSVHRKKASFPLGSKVSRVCIISASNNPEGGNLVDNGRRREYGSYSADEAPEMKETRDRALGSIYEATDSAKQRAKEMGEKTKENAERMADETKAYAQEAKERTKDTAGTLAEKTNHAAGSTTDGARETMKSAVDTAVGMGQKAKETVDAAWGAAKEKTEKIKESMVGKPEEDHVENPPRERREGERSM